MKRLDQKEINRMIRQDIDFINSKKYNYSLKQYMASFRGQNSDHKIATLLNMSQSELKQEMNNILKIYRQSLNLNVSSKDEQKF
jgi:hypothetical protein